MNKLATLLKNGHPGGDLIVCIWGISFQNNAISIRSPGKSWIFVFWFYFTFFFTLDIIFIGTLFSGISFHLPLFSLSCSSSWELSAFLFFIFLRFFSPLSSFFYVSVLLTPVSFPPSLPLFPFRFYLFFLFSFFSFSFFLFQSFFYLRSCSFASALCCDTT